MLSILKRWAGPGILFLLALGFQLSGWENIVVAGVLWAVAVLWGVIAIVKWERIKRLLSLIKQLRLVVQPAKRGTSDGASFTCPTWLQGLVDSDCKNLRNYIKIIVSEWDFSGLGQTEPYFELVLNLINASVFEVKPISVDGYITISGTRCNQPPEISSSTRERIAHGDTTSILIRQPITLETAKQLNNAGSVQTKIPFNLTKCYLDVGITTTGYESHKGKVPWGHAHAHNIIPKR